jgi:hypothetical protein
MTVWWPVVNILLGVGTLAFTRGKDGCVCAARRSLRRGGCMAAGCPCGSSSSDPVPGEASNSPPGYCSIQVQDIPCPHEEESGSRCFSERALYGLVTLVFAKCENRIAVRFRFVRRARPGPDCVDRRVPTVWDSPYRKPSRLPRGSSGEVMRAPRRWRAG